ncbi:hypothetical protein RBH29_13430 [Herbivorax sp. ANBcel31]|uniref:hypothetical protein n=1 Tax=Herbivorax sp. ANBcel31 TaxID=3069754 RepID=UPI0027B46CA6|nr:hypothetical protein [Herbivorax sp. ANBcel31]MDQ2087428.1 hypothetical protein [Herbivorax sp. ANBcel31]
MKTAIEIYKKTFSFVLLKAGVYVGAYALMAVTLGVLIGIFFLLRNVMGGLAIIIGFLIMIFVLVNVWRFAKRYFLYIVKAGFVSVVATYLTTGSLPEKGSFQHAKNTVTKHFGTTSIAAGIDLLVEKILKKINGLILKLGGIFSMLPGGKIILQIITTMLTVVIGYIDEAILGYIFLRKDDEKPWIKAKDGLVLYVKSWKSILKNASLMALGIVTIRFVSFIVFYFLFALVFGGLGNLSVIPAVMLGLILTGAISSLFLDPIVTISVLKAYLDNLENAKNTEDGKMVSMLNSVPEFNKLENGEGLDR